MKDFVEANGIVMMKADKTKTSPEIDELLVKLGNRTKQIPFYAIFPAGRPNDPIVMDGLYTSPAAFIEKLKEVGPKTAGAETRAVEPGG
jgi:thiol:disulfide interchange protein